MHWYEDECERHILEADFGRLARIGTTDDGRWVVRYSWGEKEFLDLTSSISSVKLLTQTRVKQHLLNAIKSLGD